MSDAVRRELSVVLALATLGCVYGVKPANFEPARGPEGVIAKIRIGDRALTGELLDAQPGGLLVLALQSPTPVSWVPYESIRRARFRQTGLKLRGGRAPSPATLRKLRLVSRFPQGLEGERLRRLLTVYRQTEPARVEL